MVCVFEQTSIAWRNEILVDEKLTIRGREGSDIFMRMPYDIGHTRVIISKNLLALLVASATV